MRKWISQVVFVWMLSVAVCSFADDQSKSATPKPSKAATKSDSTVLVQVNGQTVTEADLDFFAKTLKIANDELPQQREAMLERLIDRQLLRAYLSQKKVAADPERLESHLTQIKTRLKARNEDFDKLLAKSGFTEDSLRRELKLPLDWDEHVRREVTDDKLGDVWKARKAEFDGSEVRAAHIVLKSDDPVSDERRLKDVREKIVSKELSFAEAAKRFSQGTTADKGGDLGSFRFRGKQPPPFPQIAFALKVNDISEPFRSAKAVHLLTVTERIDGQDSLEDARSEILKRLSDEMQRDVLQQERTKAKIERVK